MGLPATAQGRDDGKIIDRTIVGEESHSTQNEKSEARDANGDRSPYDAESILSPDGAHGDMFDDEKELAQHPDSVTEGAELGLQKAEAAALVWSWPALVGIYAW
jgi:hypothetical protein